MNDWNADDYERFAPQRQRCPQSRFVVADIASYRYPEPPDLIFANASLHWLDGHRQLLPRLFGELCPGGDLALMPYYTVLDEWVTGLHIVNTSERAQVVKLCFRRATDAMGAPEDERQPIALAARNARPASAADAAGSSTSSTSTSAVRPLDCAAVRSNFFMANLDRG